MSLFSIVFFLQLLVGTLAIKLNMTAISANHKRESTIECWQLCTPLSISTQPGIEGAALQALGNVQTAQYAILPPHFDGGLHNAPAVQYVLFNSGLAHLTLPCSKTEAFIKGGKFGLIIAADVAGVSKLGHTTKYPSDEQTTAIAIPTLDGKIPAHTILHNGACTEEEMDLPIA